MTSADANVSVEITALRKTFNGKAAVDGVDLSVRQGETLVLLGPSGCGKTTTMRSIVGLEDPDEGRITIDGRVVFDSSKRLHIPANERGIGMVFQSYAIWPHMTVRQNVQFSLKIQKLAKRESDERVDRTLELLGLTELGPRPASLLSGGQMQRVALARSLAMRPSVLVLDEPLSNLDARLRERLRIELKELHESLKTTSIYVTHDQGEALALADRIGVMHDGKIVQLTDPVTLYRRPATQFVADFLGATNFLPGVLATGKDGTGCGVRWGTDDGQSAATVQTTCPMRGAVGDKVTLSIRPEAIGIAAAGGEPAADNTVEGVVAVASFMGDHTQYVVESSAGQRIQVKRTGNDDLLERGTKVRLTLPPAAVRVFDIEGQAWY
ncbi:iron(III) transport system ATP-binding protein [Micromonospora cremea]|uniref:Iron(III) transport system ATP-binding protein n=2 Tax=Micromonospora cremea TaxID=709881 RepID=A0A1N5VJT1_9ACTN|nr:iron(III) transport system ATP-binding protein [Micromonospora cremea]